MKAGLKQQEPSALCGSIPDPGLMVIPCDTALLGIPLPVELQLSR